MLWQEKTDKKEFHVPEDVVDLQFDIQCRELPVDHAYALAAALHRTLPWLKDDARIGVQNIHMAGSQNGWERPDPELGQKLLLSRRTKLNIRVPREREQQIQNELVGQTLDIDGNPMIIGKAKRRLLSKQTTLIARQVVQQGREAGDENLFLQRMAAELAQRGIRIKKALCGKTVTLQTPDGPLVTRSLMIADLSLEESIQLQQQGVGPHHDMGCGIFIAHKGVDAILKEDD